MVVIYHYIDWIGPRYLRIVHKLRQDFDSSFDDEWVSKLGAIDKIQRDVQQIHTWPFDTGILVRLVAILLTVAGILLSRVIYTIVVPF